MELEHLAKQYIYWPEVDNKYQKNVDLSKVTMLELHPILNLASEQNRESVSGAIARFYCLNEALAKLRERENDVLGKESIELYQTYTKEIDKLSKQMFSYIFTICIMEARHCKDYIAFQDVYDENAPKLEKKEDLFGINPNDTPEIIEATNNIANFKKNLLDRNYRNKFVTRKEYKTFCKVHDMIESLSKLREYDRDEVNEVFIPKLKDEQYSDLTVEDVFKSLSVLFNTNHFKRNYGGKAWGDIAKHGLAFVTGKINPEVFVDQAFSLEHNSGQIFNKAVIFHGPKLMQLRTNNLDSQSELSVQAYETQILLNMQHQGQLMDFLTKRIPVCHANTGWEQFNYAVSNGSIPSDTSFYNFEHFVGGLQQNSNTLHNLQATVLKNLEKSSPGLIDTIKALHLESTPLDTLKIFNKLNIDNNGFSQTWYIPEQNESFHKLNDQLLYNFEFIVNIPPKIKKNTAPFVFEHFDTAAVPNDKMNRNILGNKALGLAEMQQMNLPVPKAMVFPTTNSNSFFTKKTEWNKNLKAMLPQMKDYFRDEQGNPVLCSVRSGSAVSMPGMMDTVLNVGIDNTNYDQFCDKMGTAVTNECAVKFMTLFTKSLLGETVKYPKSIEAATNKFRKVLEAHSIPHTKKGLFPLKAEEQYKWCLHAVFSSWNSERATAYRNHEGISHTIGTAAIAQQMVFGNLNNKSCTGVAFSRDCISGEKGIIGEFLPKAQGEDVVSGAVTPINIREMPVHFPEAYSQLVSICEKLEKSTGEIQDIEFTVENKKLYILQKRKAVSSDLATIKLNYDLVAEGVITKEEMLASIKVKTLIGQDIVDTAGKNSLVNGLVANPGILRGVIVRDAQDMKTYRSLYEEHQKEKNFGWIFYAPETSPEHAPIMIGTHGFITGNGGFTSHAAILARSWKKPCVVGVGEEYGEVQLESGRLVTLDATNGRVYDGMLPLISNQNKEIKSIVKTLLKHHNINLKELKETNPFDSVIKEINSTKTWMEDFTSAKFIPTKIKPSMTNFVKLGDKVAIILAKAQEQNARFQLSSAKNNTLEDTDNKVVDLANNLKDTTNKIAQIREYSTETVVTPLTKKIGY